MAGITLDKIDAACASIKISDGTDTLAIDSNGAACVKVQDSAGDVLEINADGSFNAQFTPAGFSTWEVTAETVDDTVGGTELVATPLASRLRILIQNLGASDIYVKDATGVTTANGACIPACSSWLADLDDGADIFAITAAAGSADVRVIEFAA